MGRPCVTASNLLFDVSDRQYYDLEGPSTITFEFLAERAMRVQFAYDASAKTEQLRWIELKADSNIQRISMTLPDARLVNRGLSNTDFALIAEGAVTETDRPDHRHEFTLVWFAVFCCAEPRGLSLPQRRDLLLPPTANPPPSGWVCTMSGMVK